MKRCFSKFVDLLLIFGVIVLSAAGCSEDETVAPKDFGKIEILNIISNPLSPMPGSVDTLTPRMVGKSTGERVSFKWRVNDGILLEDEEGLVRWQVPEEKGNYLVSLRVSVAGKVDSMTKVISVRDQDIIDTGRLHSIYPNIINGDLYFISPYYDRNVSSEDRYSFADFSFYGADLYRYEDSTVSTRITEGLYEGVASEDGANYFGFTDDRQKLIATVYNGYSEDDPMPHTNIARYDLMGGMNNKITFTMDGMESINRFNQYGNPSFNSDGSTIVMEFIQAGEEGDGSQDLVNIAFWEEGDGVVPETLTESTAELIVKGIPITVYYQNILPQLTPDGNNIIYFSNKISVLDTLPNYYEPYIIPLVAGEPDTSQTEFVDIVRGEGIRIDRNEIFQWSPTGDVAAFNATVRMVSRLCYLNYNSLENSISINVSGLTDVEEFVWSPDGSMGAIIDRDGVYLVSPDGGRITQVLNKENDTDDFYGINWSPDGEKIAFRLVRKGDLWLDSWNAIMEYTISDGVLTYISKAYRWAKNDEPSEIDYRWKRVQFDGMDGIYAPVFTSADDNTLVSVSRIVHLY